MFGTPFENQFNLTKDFTNIGKDLRWSWSHEADEVWDKIDSELWAITRNPWLILQSIGSNRLKKLSQDKEFMDSLIKHTDKIEKLLSLPGWFQKNQYDKKINSIAYFCMEFGLSEALPIYSGGLGILAGDFLKTASDLKVPVIGVGLLYQQGYFRQVIDSNNEQKEFYPYNEPSQLPIERLKNEAGASMHVTVELPGRPVRLRIWKASIGRVILYLLDSNDPFNSPPDRGITSELYGGNKETRLQQEIILGIGGWRLLEILKIKPDICHLNEGHAAFAILERVRYLIKQHNLPFNIALTTTRPSNIFTTHTPVAAGFDVFDENMMHKYFYTYVKHLNIDFKEFMELGSGNNSYNNFNMAYLAINGSGVINGVSKLHRDVSKRIFVNLFPRWPANEIPITYVTNGIHVPSWDSKESNMLWEKYCGKDRWFGSLETIIENSKKITDEEIWTLRTKNRTNLVKYVRKRLIRQLASIAANYNRIKEAENMFDPNVMTIGFARRFAGYKRPTLLLHNKGRLIKLLNNSKQPIQIVIAGKAHPKDEIGRSMIKEWNDFISTLKLCCNVAFISDYDMLLASQLVQGVDLWINNPRKPWEASGTSGMKILANGGLNLSELDGWWAEAYKNDYGWSMDDGLEHHDDNPYLDERESEHIYNLLENEIIPLFYNRDEKGIPRKWIQKIRKSMFELTPRFSTNRMLREYVEKIYLNCAVHYHKRVKDNFSLSTQIERTNSFLREHWQLIHFGNLIIKDRITLYKVSLQVYLDDIDPDLVEVQLYADALNSYKKEIYTMKIESQLSGYGKNFNYTIEIPKKRPIEHFTPRIISSCNNTIPIIENKYILWYK